MRYPEKSTIMLGVFVVIWLTDTGAYFVGKAIGRHKLAKEISPSKTWEGFFGGLFFGILTSYLLMKFGNIESYHQGFLLAIVVILASVLGDLTESSWKRYKGIKDSGSLLQGHGGFLDRLDSFIYSVPIVLILYELHIITI